ncbi:hypothetical protein F4859DRAFT_402501 [Xylaria cf. heliscus]|nr:hypothetical protein F4859DRAFT_402501 [Xylaria cf. heliscus]
MALGILMLLPGLLNLDSIARNGPQAIKDAALEGLLAYHGQGHYTQTSSERHPPRFREGAGGRYGRKCWWQLP